MTESSREGASEAVRRPRVLIADDEPALCRAVARALRHAGYDVITAENGRSALEYAAESDFDAVVSDIRMPDMNGIDLLRGLRERDLDVPVILVTASPEIGTAQEAIELGAFHYISKPIELRNLTSTVKKAVQLREVARLKNDALGLFPGAGSAFAERKSSESMFDRALETLWMAYQPILWAQTGRLFGHEALLRAEEPGLPDPIAVLRAAERLGRQTELARKARATAATGYTEDDRSDVLFVNLHPMDLLDDAMMSHHAPLTAIARRVVLEVTERESLENVANVRQRVASLRSLGFRIAIDDLGAGYAGLMSFAHLEPDIVKLDMALVRDVHLSSTKRRLVRSMIQLCKDLEILVVAEGIESIEERDYLMEAGCDLVQGYLLAKPGRRFPQFSWP